jgi:hypothetical protein
MRMTQQKTGHYTRGDGGFACVGDYLLSVARAGWPGSGEVDDRLFGNAPSTVGTEGTGPDGGYSVPPDYRTEIEQSVGTDDRRE